MIYFNKWCYVSAFLRFSNFSFGFLFVVNLKRINNIFLEVMDLAEQDIVYMGLCLQVSIVDI